MSFRMIRCLRDRSIIRTKRGRVALRTSDAKKLPRDGGKTTGDDTIKKQPIISGRRGDGWIESSGSDGGESEENRGVEFAPAWQCLFAPVGEAMKNNFNLAK